LAVLSLADQVEITAQSDSRFLLVAGKPINESVARGGPFVMNTPEEITQAFADYKSGEFA
ncbi:MAG: pirin-like C-terminal cupin domain-containing protein, partial [Thiotrichaceae bacterium]